MDVQTYGFLWLIVTLLFGLLTCFFGYRLFLVLVGILGFALGASLGYFIGDWLGSGIISLVLVLILGLLGAWASITAYYAFIFVVGAFGFALLVAFLVGLYTTGGVSILFPIIAGFVGGFLALWLQRIIIILATAAQGALASVLAVAAMIQGGGMWAYRELYYRLLDGQLARPGDLRFYAGLLIWVLLFGAGLFAQLTRGKEMYRRRRKVAGSGEG